jgi:hypothetical protein
MPNSRRLHHLQRFAFGANSRRSFTPQQRTQFSNSRRFVQPPERRQTANCGRSISPTDENPLRFETRVGVTSAPQRSAISTSRREHRCSYGRGLLVKKSVATRASAEVVGSGMAIAVAGGDKSVPYSRCHSRKFNPSKSTPNLVSQPSVG